VCGQDESQRKEKNRFHGGGMPSEPKQHKTLTFRPAGGGPISFLTTNASYDPRERHQALGWSQSETVIRPLDLIDEEDLR